MLQFECPACAAKLRVPDSAMGQSAPCPKCGHLLLVPTLETASPNGATPSPAAGTAPPASEPVPPRTTEAAVSELLGSLQESSAASVAADPVLAVTRRAQQQNRASVITGLFFLIIAVGLTIGVYLWVKPTMTASLTGEPAAATVRAERFLPAQKLGLGGEIGEFHRRQAGQTLRINSQILLTSIESQPRGLQLRVEPAPGHRLVRVDVLTQPQLSAFHLEHYRELEQRRLAVLKPGTAELFEQFAVGSAESLRSPQRLLEFRDQVILPGLVDALGFSLAGFVGSTQYACVFQDADDRLYFVIPADVSRFEIRERDIAGQPRFFPNHLRLMVTLPKPAAESTAVESTPVESIEVEPAEDSSGTDDPEMTPPDTGAEDADEGQASPEETPGGDAAPMKSADDDTVNAMSQ